MTINRIIVLVVIVNRIIVLVANSSIILIIIRINYVIIVIVMFFMNFDTISKSLWIFLYTKYLILPDLKLLFFLSKSKSTLN